MKRFLSFFLILVLALTCVNAKDKSKKKDPMNPGAFSGLKFRNIGPAFPSGRIADFAVNPNNHSEYYVGVACGHIWKTVNNGVTWKPVFDNYGSYSIGALAIDPNNTNVIWAGTGENNHQRALAYGDGVYKSVDGGQSWKNMGLKESKQIGKILIDPRNSNVVYVAAEGSVWGPGGERGLYKTEDGGKTWKIVLEISENTGVNNVVLDPRNPDVLYATSEQRRRRFNIRIGGGPESAVYKSEDAGKSWRKIEKGLPSVHKGGMGIAISPVNPDVLYLIVEAQLGKGGFFRSVNRGESWQKMSSHASSGQYYNEIYCDPVDVDKVYSVETFTHFTKDAGKTWQRLSLKGRHVDDHALWIDPQDTKHFMIGGDGGIYETYDSGKEWLFKSNLPVTQFYRVSVDEDYPFYNVYGGTQDNNSMGGPSRTLSRDGIVSSDWFVTNGGDGFWGAADPKNPNIVYAESQYGGMVRYDRKSGESIGIRPEPRKGEKTYKWNWDTPLLISPHNHKRIYCAANKIFRSEDRGDNWAVISDDLSAKISRDEWPVMGKFWSTDAVSKNVSTSQYGMVISLTESPLKENLLYAGTDDGLIQVTENAKDWKRYEEFPEVPKHSYVSDILADRFNENIVYATFKNDKRNDFKPYVLKSTDKGKNWEVITNNLPANGVVHTIEQDHVNSNLLFVGTEFGIYFSVNGGKKWIQLKAGIPTVAVRDIAIQRRENDLVLATFGRGFYVLDDYTPLREANPELFKKDAHIFPVKDALMYMQTRGRYGQGSTYFKAKNPAFGATFTYYVKESAKTKKQKRHAEERKLFKDSKRIPQPSYLEVRAEDNEIKPHLIFTITDAQGNFVRKITKPVTKGINRVNWDLYYESLAPVSVSNNTFNPLKSTRGSSLALPGKYFVSISKYIDGQITKLVEPVEFTAKVLNNTTLPAVDRKALVKFQKDMQEMYRTIRGTQQFHRDLIKKVEYIRQALYSVASAKEETILKANKLREELDQIDYKLYGQRPKASREENFPAQVSINERLNAMVWGHWGSTSNITGVETRSYEILREEFPPVLNRLKEIFNKDIKELETELEKIKAPWTPGRIPIWNN
ncbi:MAG: WD40/YVTN/BNR-like repeat-containing protein [Rhodothermaceae bacterium]